MSEIPDWDGVPIGSFRIPFMRRGFVFYRKDTYTFSPKVRFWDRPDQAWKPNRFDAGDGLTGISCTSVHRRELPILGQCSAQELLDVLYANMGDTPWQVIEPYQDELARRLDLSEVALNRVLRYLHRSEQKLPVGSVVMEVARSTDALTSMAGEYALAIEHGYKPSGPKRRQLRALDERLAEELRISNPLWVSMAVKEYAERNKGVDPYHVFKLSPSSLISVAKRIEWEQSHLQTNKTAARGMSLERLRRLV